MAYWKLLAQEKFGASVETHLEQTENISITLVPWCSHLSLFVETGLLGQTRVCLKVFQVIREPSSTNCKAVIKDLLIQLQWKNRGLHKELARSNIWIVSLYYTSQSFAVEEVGTGPAYTKGHEAQGVDVGK